jgi:hypothetical protein
MLDDVEPSSLYQLFDDALAAAVETAGALPSLTSLDCRAGIARPANKPVDRSIIFIPSWPPASSNPARIGFCLFDRNSSSPSKVTISKTVKAEPRAAGSR